MSQTTERKASAAAAPRGPSDQSAESLPTWLYLWLPVIVAVVLILIGHQAGRFYDRYLGSEVGLLEAAHVVIPLIAVIYGIRILMLPQARRDLLILPWIILGILGCIYIAGEEASWGQHYFGWLTPESWEALNDQGETNLHNTSSWFDQKPRTVLELGVIVGGIVVPLLALVWPRIRQGRFALFLPPLVCLPVAVIAEVAKFWERLQSHGLYDFLLFRRASEIQELYFVLFILFYLMVFHQRLLAQRPAGPPGV